MKARTQPTIETLEDAEAWLGGLINLERDPADRAIRLGLEAIRALCERIGNPQRSLSALHVAGSKGKGSVCLFAEAILLELGERVGTFTSPHLERWTERFRIDGEAIDGASLAGVVAQLRPHVEALRGEGRGRSPSFFDATTAAAFLLFARARVDRAVLEVGLGGRLDSTNVVEAVVECVTSIELEHTDRLGDSLALIAAEKAGILKPCVPCVVGPLAPEAMHVVEQRARVLDAPLARVGREIELRIEPPARSRAGSDASPSSPLRSLPSTRFWMRDQAGFEVRVELPLVGDHHALNAALAIACVRRLGTHDDAAVGRAAVAALARCGLPARCEVLRTKPWLLIDAAHTAASAAALARVLEALPPEKRHFVLSVSSGKALGAILDALLPLASSVVATRADAHRSMDPEQLARAVSQRAPGLPVCAVDDAASALREARRALAETDLLCVTGSVYLAGIARRELRADLQR